MSDKNSSVGSESQVSGVGQTASIGRSTSVSSGAAKVFREFKWGLLTLFLLMVVVVGLVYDGGAKKKLAEKPKTHDPAMDINLDGMSATPPSTPGNSSVANDPLFAPAVPGADTGTGSIPVVPGNPMDYAATPPGIPNGSNPGIVTIPATPTNPGAHIQPGNNPRVNDLHYNSGTNDVVVVQPTQPTQPTNPQVDTQPTTPTAKKTYTVKPGDTLSSIASSQKLGKGGLKSLIAANKTTLPNPDRLKVGMVLNVPEVASAAPVKQPEANVTVKVDGSQPTKPAPKIDAAPAPTGGSEYTVQNGDTLERIARKFFNDGRRWKDIQNWNRDQLADPSRLRVGQVLKIKQVTDATPTAGGKPAKTTKVSEAEDVVPSEEPKKEVVDSLPQPEVKEKVVATKEKKSKKVVKEEEPQVEVMSSTSAFAP